MEIELEKNTAKAKRKIKALDFSGANAAVALVSKEQGGPANGIETLCIKAANFSDAFLEKMQTIRVELTVPDFLEAFFKLEEDDSKALAFMLGYREDLQEEAMEPEQDFNKWVMENMESFEIVKSLRDAEDYVEVLSNLNEEQYLALLEDQQRFEKAMKKQERDKEAELAKLEAERKMPRIKTAKKSTEVAKAAEASVNTSITQREVKEGKGISPVVKQSNKDKSMADNVKVIEQLVETEVVEKSQFEAIQKQAQEQAELLKAAMQELEVFKAEKAAFIAKARKQALVDAAKDEAKADQLFKAVGSLDDADFNAVVDVVKSLATAIEKSDLFVEKGVSAETEVAPVKDNALERLLKAKFQAK